MKLPPFFEEDRLAVDARLEKTVAGGFHAAPIYPYGDAVFGVCRRASVSGQSCAGIGAIFEAEVSPALYPGCAIEFIHTYFADSRRPARAGQRRFAAEENRQATRNLERPRQFWRVDALLTLAFETIAATPFQRSAA